MPRTIKIAAIGVLAALALAACGTETLVGDKGSPSPAPTQSEDERTRHDEKAFTIETPEGWTRKVVTKDADAKTAIRYNGPDGEYFIVALDPLGSDYTYDALWNYKVVGTRFEIASQKECAGTSDQSCSDDDDRYDGYIMWETGASPVKVGGHTWYFMFGDADSTTVEAEVFEDIFASIKVKTA